MKILIILIDTIPLIVHETLSLAFALASFGHDIQLEIGDEVANFLLENSDNPLTKMLSSLDLYDIPRAWISVEIYQKFMPSLPENLSSQLTRKPANMADFDTTLSF